MGFCTYFALGIFFLLRRENGFFNRSIPLAGIVIFSVTYGTALLLLYLLLRFWASRLADFEFPVRRTLAGILLTVFLLTGLAVQIPGTSVLVQLVFALAFLCVTALIARFEFHKHTGEKPVPSVELEVKPDETTEEPVESSGEELEGDVEEESEEESEEELLAPDVSQQLSRLELPGGGVEISGLLRGNFGPNQTKTRLFVAFCPPFCRTPTVECFSVDGAAEVEIVQNAPHGVQLCVHKTSRVPFDDSVVLTFRAS